MRQIIGRWVRVDGKVLGDVNENQIDTLISTRLSLIWDREGGWTRLYKDTLDGSFWELTFPESGRHGGGPRTLSEISVEDVSQLYGLDQSQL